MASHVGPLFFLIAIFQAGLVANGETVTTFLTKKSPQQIRTIRSDTNIFQTSEDPEKYFVALTLQEFTCLGGSEQYIEVRNSQDENSTILTKWVCQKNSRPEETCNAIGAVTGSSFFNVSLASDVGFNQEAKIIATLYQKKSGKCSKGYFDCGGNNAICISNELRCDRYPSCGQVGCNLDEKKCRDDDNDNSDEHDSSNERDDDDDDDDDDGKLIAYIALPIGFFCIVVLIILCVGWWRRTHDDNNTVQEQERNSQIRIATPSAVEINVPAHKEMLAAAGPVHSNSNVELTMDLPPSYGECVPNGTNA